MTGQSLSLYINKRNEEITVKVIDNKSAAIIREISSLELQDIKDRINDTAGRLFKKN